jgi:hypothetical protein
MLLLSKDQDLQRMATCTELIEWEFSDASTERNLEFNPGGMKTRIPIKVMRSLKSSKENFK